MGWARSAVIGAGAAVLAGCAPPPPAVPAALILSTPSCRTVTIPLSCPGEPVAMAACQDGEYYLFEDGRRERAPESAEPPAFRVRGPNDPPKVCPPG